MDYCEDFDVIKSICEYANDNLKLFSKIQFRGGNEEAIKEIINRIQKHFISKNYFDNKKDNALRSEFEQNFRKITFFLMLNTDVAYKYDLSNDQYICHLLGVLPQLTTCLLVHMIWGLNLQEYFYEVVSYSPCWFSFQFVAATIPSIKYLDPYETLQKVESLVKAVLMSVSRSELFELDAVDKKIILGKYHDFVMDLLRQFYTPDREKFSTFSKWEFYKYSGFAIKHILDMVLFSFDTFEILPTEKIEEKYRIYYICPEEYRKKADNYYYSGGLKLKGKQHSDVVAETLNKIIAALLNSLQYNVMLVKIDVFMHWVETDFEEGETLQSVVGGQSYKVLEIMQLKKMFAHDVAEQLKFIAIRPKTLEERLKEATIGEILCKIDNEDFVEKKQYFNELLHRGDIVYGNDECLDTIRSNTKLMSVDNCLKMLEYIKLQMIKDYDEDDDYDNEGDICQKVIAVLLKSLQNFNSEQLELIHLYYIKLNGCDSNVLQQKDLNQRCNEFFNKYLSVFDTQTFLQLSLENPSKLWKTFFDEGCVVLQHANNFCTTLKAHPKLGKFFVWDLVKSSFPGKCSEQYYPNLLTDICNSGVIEKELFFKEFIYKNVLDTLETNSYNELLVLIKTLIRIANNSPTCFGNVTAPILVMAGTVLEKCRWDLVTYEDIKDEIVKLSIEFIQIVSAKFLSSANEKDRKWITNKIGEHRPITRYYFQKFQLKQDQPIDNFDVYLQRGNKNTEKDGLEKFLTSVYVRCSSKEISWLSKNPALLKLFPEVILIIEKIVTDVGDDNAINNFRYCIVNYINILRKRIIPELTGKRDEAIDLGFKTLKLVDRSPRSIYDEIYMNFQQIILDIFEKTAPIDEEVVKNVKSVVANMQDCKGKELLHEKFQAMAIETLMSSCKNTNSIDQQT